MGDQERVDGGVRVGGRLPKRVESRIGCAKFNETGQGLRQENPQHQSPPVTRREKDSDQREARETKNYEPGGMEGLDHGQGQGQSLSRSASAVFPAGCSGTEYW